MYTCCDIRNLISVSTGLLGPMDRYCKKTVEAGVDATMETESATIATEQPRTASPPPSPVETGPVTAKAVVQQAPSVMEGETNVIGDGSAVDGGQLVDIQPVEASSNTGAAVGSGVKKQVTDSDRKSVEPKQVKNGAEDTASVHRLANLAQQIEDFKPLELLTDSPGFGEENGKENSDSVQVFRDINDEKLIDELVESTDKSVPDEGNKSNGGKVINNKGDVEVTPGNDSEKEGTPDIEIVDSSDGSKSADDDSGKNGVENPLSLSTESDGFAEEKQNESASDGQGEGEEKQTNKAPEVVLTQKKPETQKSSENTSPTKTAKSKKKEDKSIEHILKALSSLQTTEEKLAALCKKYADLHEDHRILQSTNKLTLRKLTMTTREKDQLQTEHTKAVMAKSKLESLCRELQKHNQTIRQESLQRAKEEDEKRKEISQKFQTTISEIQAQMQDNHERNKQLREENFELANKLKKFIEQYEAREKQVEKVIQHRELEQKLADAKLEQASAILNEERGRSQKEKELLLMKSTEYLKKMQLKEAELTMYKERYDEFQTTIKKSEEMFTKFKTEMDKMTKRCKKLEKDGAQWKGKWENANRALLEMAEEKTKTDRERGVLMTKINKLESLCRAMQAERQARKVLQDEGIDVSKLSLTDTIPTASEPSEAPCPPPPVPSPSTTPGNDLSPTGDEPETPDNNSDPESDQSGGSEKTGITVIPQDSIPAVETPDTSQETPGAVQSEQSEPEAVPADQSETSCEQPNQTEIVQAAASS